MLASAYIRAYVPLVLTAGLMLVVSGVLAGQDRSGHPTSVGVWASALGVGVVASTALFGLRSRATSRTVLATATFALGTSGFAVGALGPGTWRVSTLTACVALLLLVVLCTVVRADDAPAVRASRLDGPP